ncbi:MAG: hypothetical protein JNK79_12485 [Chitinophagaceae bacterium]|nr:hypothetical protein [Chitinophagaceae bacterium]
MKYIHTQVKPLTCALVAMLLFITTFAQKEYTGSTPADPQVRTALKISHSTPIDFIRWDLQLRQPRKFILTITYGESQPNTLGFKNGGTQVKFEGAYQVAVIDRIATYTLRTGPGAGLSLKMINDQLLHVVANDGTLMVGNGGWSYTLTKKNTTTIARPLAIKSPLRAFKDSITIFEGRTPCQEISEEYNFGAPSGCFKLKWLLTLTKDSSSYRSGTFVLNRTLERANLINGKWSIDSSGVIRLEPVKGQPMSLISGDENVLFFMNKEGAVFNGDENFSYVLNRRKKA